jgi:uncharacterized HAD superfamily protein
LAYIEIRLRKTNLDVHESKIICFLEDAIPLDSATRIEKDMTNADVKISPNELAFDIDGVFADTFRVFVETARNEYGLDFEYEDITEYDFRSVLDIDEGISREIIGRILDYPIEMGIRPIIGAVEVLTGLSRHGPLLFVTARSNKESIFRWIHRQLRWVDKGVIRIEATGNHQEKLPVLLKHGIKYFVEDRLDTCDLLAKASVTPIVFEQPWNRKPHSFQSVKNWDDISHMIDW